MPSGFNFRVLVVDDEPSVRDTSAALLGSRGYEVRTAADGFAALVELRRALPDVIISDLKMPNMSGFELLSVIRRRFPQIPVIAISGEYDASAPQGLISDAFFTKAAYTPEELFSRIAELLEQSPLRPHVHKPDRAPVWTPRGDAGYFVLSCPECLRSFSVPDEERRANFEKRAVYSVMPASVTLPTPERVSDPNQCVTINLPQVSHADCARVGDPPYVSDFWQEYAFGSITQHPIGQPPANRNWR